MIRFSNFDHGVLEAGAGVICHRYRNFSDTGAAARAIGRFRRANGFHEDSEGVARILIGWAVAARHVNEARARDRAERRLQAELAAQAAKAASRAEVAALQTAEAIAPTLASIPMPSAASTSGRRWLNLHEGLASLALQPRQVTQPITVGARR